MAKIGAVINKESGTLSQEQKEKRLEEIKAHLEARTSPEYLAIVSGSQVGEEVKRLMEQEIDVLIIGGGDGTISTAAGLVSDTEITLAVLGLGTRNHFARDLGIPQDPVEAIRLVDRLNVQDIDLGEVNGYKFINNASLGLYPKIVREREKREKWHGWQKWRAQIAASLTVLRRLPQMRLTVEDDQNKVNRLTPFLFVGNNEYQGIISTGSSRTTMSGGRLWLCMGRSSGFGGLFGTVWQIIIKGFQNADNLETRLVTSVVVSSWRKSITIAVDGETHRLTTPLRFKVREKSLRVVVP